MSWWLNESKWIIQIIIIGLVYENFGQEFTSFILIIPILLTSSIFWCSDNFQFLFYISPNSFTTLKLEGTDISTLTSCWKYMIGKNSEFLDLTIKINYTEKVILFFKKPVYRWTKKIISGWYARKSLQQSLHILCRGLIKEWLLYNLLYLGLFLKDYWALSITISSLHPLVNNVYKIVF